MKFQIINTDILIWLVQNPFNCVSYQHYLKKCLKYEPLLDQPYDKHLNKVKMNQIPFNFK